MKNYKNFPIDPTPTPPSPTLTLITVTCPREGVRRGGGVYVVVGGYEGGWGYVRGVRRWVGLRWGGGGGYVGGGGGWLHWGGGYVGGGDWGT